MLLFCLAFIFPISFSPLRYSVVLYGQWRAEGGADSATAPGIHPGGIQGASFL